MFDHTITIQIRNRTNQPQNWYAFGFNQGLQNPNGVAVSINERSAETAARQSSTNPYLIDNIKIKTQSELQLQSPITITTSEITGQSSQKVMIPSDYLDMWNGIIKLVKIYNTGFKIQGKTLLSGTIAPNQAMSITLNLKQEKKISNFIINSEI